MDKNELLIIADYSDAGMLTIEELCALVNMSPEEVQRLIAYEIIFPVAEHPDKFHFNLVQLQRLHAALRLQRDLEMNLASIAIVLDLLDEVRETRRQAEMWKKHLLE